METGEAESQHIEPLALWDSIPTRTLASEWVLAYRGASIHSDGAVSLALAPSHSH